MAKKILLIRYWLGPKYYFQVEQALKQKNNHMILFNHLNFIFVALIPIFLINAFLFCVIWSAVVILKANKDINPCAD